MAPAFSLQAATFEELPDWQTDQLHLALPALARSCQRLAKQPDDRPLGPDGLAGTVGDWRAACQAINGTAAGDNGALKALLTQEFRPFLVMAGDSDQGLFTGYYEAELKGATFPGGDYSWPIYRKPDDMVTVDLGRFRADLEGERLVGRVEKGRLVPYYTREEIDRGALAGRNLELLWVDDPADSFFLHVQGSGQVVLPDGSRKRIGFAGSNGLPFFAIGRAMIDEGIVSRQDASAQSIMAWLRENPEDGRAMMARNPRFIFFREIDGDGPIGSQGVALEPGRSLAVDPAFLPLGAPLWLDTTWPGTDKPLRRLVVAQDTGNAIKGPVRGDLFWGAGAPALEQAGRMKQKGRYFLLLPKAVAERRELGS
ncbi:MAG: MltA domain-containing protein [Pseudomonadota bacterium]